MMSRSARVGLPEVKLGINPGFGGTVRLPRVIGVDNAVEWICGGSEYKAEVALKVGVVDAVVDPARLRVDSPTPFRGMVASALAPALRPGDAR